MANTTADKLALLEATKADLKAALAEKGQTVGDVFSTYPAAVRAIETGGGTATVQIGHGNLALTCLSIVTVDGYITPSSGGSYVVPVPCLISYFNPHDTTTVSVSGMIQKEVDEFVAGMFSRGIYCAYTVTGDCKIGL